ncbi:MAG TPA: hypothetical protein DCM08_09720 [Microscillaceae bacterium]|nr:hypothetical protein [Microscillaceae bacterium]
MMGARVLFNINQTSFTNADETCRMFIESLSDMGMNFYEPFDVSGYDAYHQEPMFNRAWISTNRLTNRYKFIEDLLRTDMMGGNNAFGFSINLIQYCERTISDPSNPNILVDEFVNIALPQTITTERRNYFKFVLNADLPDMNWTVEWSRRNNPGSAVPMQLQKFFNAVLQSPEYQLF